MVKPLVFKGEKKSTKRKARSTYDQIQPDGSGFDTLTTSNSNEKNDEVDSWISAETPSDIIGPIIFALLSSPPSCITCDTNGKVFLSNIENIVDGNLTTAEPHDVRQVWVASRIAGTEGISFKGHHGRYLSCDESGLFSALSEAISPGEIFLCVPSDGILGAFYLQAEHKKFLTVSNVRDPEIRGDSDLVSCGTMFRIQMQARFKPKLIVSKERKAREKISQKEIEYFVGGKLEDSEMRKLKKARVQGNYHEMILDAKIKKKHDKYA